MVWVLILGVVVVVVVVGIVALVAILGKGGLPSRFPPGTRAFEAELTMGPLMLTIQQRTQELGAETDPGKRQKLEKKIAFLSAQVPQLQQIIAAKDMSPGRGYIGFDAPPED